MEDSEIVNLFLARDENAIAKTKEKYSSRIQRLAYELTEDIRSAEECENDTYLQVWNSIPPNKPYDYFYPFLARIARHIALNICRDRNRKKRKAAIGELSEELQQTIPGNWTIDDHIQESELHEIIDSFLAGIDADKRKIFVRRYWYMDSIQTIANGFGISQGNVKVTLYRLRKQLRKVIESEGYHI